MTNRITITLTPELREWVGEESEREERKPAELCRVLLAEAMRRSRQDEKFRAVAADNLRETRRLKRAAKKAAGETPKA